jgi:hypothetical protein
MVFRKPGKGPVLMKLSPNFEPNTHLSLMFKTLHKFCVYSTKEITLFHETVIFYIK